MSNPISKDGLLTEKELEACINDLKMVVEANVMPLGYTGIIGKWIAQAKLLVELFDGEFDFTDDEFEYTLTLTKKRLPAVEDKTESDTKQSEIAP